mgnify:CR=1 FL=1
MSDFETLMMCFLVPCVYVVTYICGKYDVITLIGNMLQERVDEYVEKRGRGDHADTE